MTTSRSDSATPAKPRFVVGETRGYRIRPGSYGSGTGGRAQPHAGYAVLDTHVSYTLICEIASEDHRGGARLGPERARQKAQEIADGMNEQDDAGWPEPPPAVAPKGTLADQVVAILADGKDHHSEDLADALGISRSNFSSMVVRDLIGKGRAVRVSLGVYRAA